LLSDKGALTAEKCGIECWNDQQYHVQLRSRSKLQTILKRLHM
jgi:hypothetical protein